MNAFVFVNLTLTICCMIFHIFLCIVYFSKKNMKNIETKIYRQLLLLNGEYVLTHVFMVIFEAYLSNLTIIIHAIIRIYWTSLGAWSLFFTYYVFIVTNEKNK